MATTLAADEPTFAIPGPRPMPVVGPMGNFLQFGLDPIGFMGNTFKKYGHIAAMAEGGGFTFLPNESTGSPITD